MASPAPVDVVKRPVWGKAAPSPTTSAPVETTEKASDEEECKICFDRKITNTFQPCKHGACSDCVDSLRHSVIFKADKGVKCPYCRQFILGFELTGTTGDSKAKQKLKESNAAAKAAALARMPVQKRVVDPQAAKVAPGGANMWTCPKCTNRNLENRKVCNRCNEVAPLHVIQQIVAGGKNVNVPDIAKASRKDIQEAATAKLHPRLNSALAEAGMPFNTLDGSFMGAGDIEGVKAAVLHGRHKKLCHIFECLLGDGTVARLATEVYYGNYTLQDLIQAASRLRAAVVALQKAGSLSKEEANAARGVNASGLDFLGRIAKELGEISATAIIHSTGNYVLEKVVDYGQASDVAAILAPLCKNPYAFSTHKYGMMKFAKGVDKLCAAAFEPGPQQKEASLLLNELCRALLKPENTQRAGHVDRLTWMMFHDLGGPMILEAAQGGLPHDHAIKLLGRVVESVNTLKAKPTGMNMLKKFLGLEARNSTCREIIVTNVCILAKALRSSYADTMVNVTDGSEIIQRMLELLSQEDDATCREWVACIVAELVENSPRLLSLPQPRAVLLSAMQLPHIAKGIPNYLEMVRRKYGPQFCAELAAAIDPNSVLPGAEKSAITPYLQPPTQQPPPPRAKSKALKLANGKAAKAAAAATAGSNHSSRAPNPPATPPLELTEPAEKRSNPPIAPTSHAHPLFGSHSPIQHPPAGFNNQGFAPALAPTPSYGNMHLQVSPQGLDLSQRQTNLSQAHQAVPQRAQQHVVTPPLEAKPLQAALPPGFQQGGGVAKAPSHQPHPQPPHNPSLSNPPQPVAVGQGPRGPPPAVKSPSARQNNAAQDFLGDLLPGLGLADILQNGPSGGGRSSGGSYGGSNIPTAESVLAAAPRGVPGPAPPRQYHSSVQHNRPAYMPPAAHSAAPSDLAAVAPPTATAHLNAPGAPPSLSAQPPLQNGGGRIPRAATNPAPRHPAADPRATFPAFHPPAAAPQAPPGLATATGGQGRKPLQMSSRVKSMYNDLLGGGGGPAPASAAPPPGHNSHGFIMPQPFPTQASAAAARKPVAATPTPPPAHQAAWVQKQKGNESWSCAICTYKHQDMEAEFLTCKLCGSVR